MMRVSGWPTLAEAQCAADRYARCGYVVAIMVTRCAVTGAQVTDYWLECRERAA